MTTTETDWRAELLGGEYNQSLPEDERIYRVVDASGIIVSPAIAKRGALQMVADHGKAALCEELADALEKVDAWIMEGWTEDDVTGEAVHPAFARALKATRAALKAAGRAPQ